MNDTIKIVYKNYLDKQDTMNVPLIKEEDTQLVFKTQQDDNNHTILFNNYYYSYLQTVKIEQDNNTIDLNNNEVSNDTQSALYSSDLIRRVDIQYIIIVYDGENYKIFSNLLREDDQRTDEKFKNNPIIDIEYIRSTSNNMSPNNHYIVSTCVDGNDMYFILPKDGLSYIPEKIQEIYSQDNPTISRIKDVKQHSYEVSDFAIENRIDPVDYAFEQYEFLEEKIQEALKDINNSVNMINDNTTVDKVSYIKNINKISDNLLPIAQLIEQWRQIMLSY